MSRLFISRFTLASPLNNLRLALAELSDLAGQLITVDQGIVTLHLDRATLANVAAQLRHALAGA